MAYFLTVTHFVPVTIPPNGPVSTVTTMRKSPWSISVRGIFVGIFHEYP